MNITGTTQLLGVIGDPISHSLSPVMHNAALQVMGLDYVYLPFAITPDNLATAIAGFAAIGIQGFNVTIPHKQAIMPLLTEVSELAQAVGAVNTVWRTATGWAGTNTDVEGFLAPLKSLDRDWSQVSVVCLGNGGAARAVVAGCAQLGCAAIQVVGRSGEKLRSFHASWQDSPWNMNLSVHGWEVLANLIPNAGLIVNTTPLGMHSHSSDGIDSPLSHKLAQGISANAIAYDLIYIPNPTLFLQQAGGQGAIAIDGLEMLVQQGAAALRLWTGEAVPVAVMRNALKARLNLA